MMRPQSESLNKQKAQNCFIARNVLMATKFYGRNLIELTTL